jgi:hypothetical protein
MLRNIAQQWSVHPYDVIMIHDSELSFKILGRFGK